MLRQCYFGPLTSSAHLHSKLNVDAGDRWLLGSIFLVVKKLKIAAVNCNSQQLVLILRSIKSCMPAAIDRSAPPEAL